VVTLTVLALQVIPLSGLRADRIHMLRCDVAAFEGAEQEMEQVLDQYLERRWLVEARSVRFGESLSLRYRVVVKDPSQVSSLLREVGSVEGVERVVLDLGDEGPDREE